jgi:hypothetical protein
MMRWSAVVPRAADLHDSRARPVSEMDGSPGIVDRQRAVMHEEAKLTRRAAGEVGRGRGRGRAGHLTCPDPAADARGGGK